MTLETQTAQAARKPNIIYIMADDLGYGDLGCYGQKQIKTPNIDRLARRGMKFTDHYAGHTVCRPSRLVLLTGRHSGHTPISANVPYELSAGAETVTTIMKRAGYKTAGFGKWALGDAESDGAPFRQGFDSWFGYLDQHNAHNYYPEYLWQNDTKFMLPGNKVGKDRLVSIERGNYSHDLMTDQLLKYISRNETVPFFLQVHYTIPHANNEGGRATGNGMEVPNYGQYADRDWPDVEKGMAAMVSLLDTDIGRLMGALKFHHLEENTLVIFTSDNGPHQEGGHKVKYFDSNGPLRGYKRDLYDGGIRVPLIACWPGMIKPGTVSNHVSAFWDFLPTTCELAGVDLPIETDGISYVPTLLGKQQAEHDLLYWHFRGKAALRQGKWKAVRPGRQTG